MKEIEKIDKKMDKIKETEGKIKQFSEILDSLQSTEDKKKLLWKEIYQNAVEDRDSANKLFSDAYNQMGGGMFEHATMGAVMTKYLERMNKSNEQILKLAELISKAEEKASQVSPDELFAKISE
jgi:prefoldin subunit 5